MSVVLRLQEWNRPVDAGDLEVLAHCQGPTLDIGCGPGRMAAHLAGQGRTVLGVDALRGAVSQARQRGATALQRNVFGPLPGEGRWGTALLADGNIGIGGDPDALLRRVAAVLDPGGRVVVDLGPPETGTTSGWVRLQDDGPAGPPMRWSWVGADDIDRVATRSGFRVTCRHARPGRWFAVLARAA
jgi:SAM-dependent methyltransferase